MGSSPLGLPPLPPELKSILPYLQRADELKNQDPIISYWCAYYAAQLGIGLKSRDIPSRDLLLALLDVLEKMKVDIGPNDTLDIEAVSSAYIERFGLKVFAIADNEDRNGHATRSTAKKFLAAANFLQVLYTFPKVPISDTMEEKIRYAKWKAADIAKAFREGRKPAPGPPGWEEEQEEQRHLEREQEHLSIDPSTHLQLPPRNDFETSHPEISSLAPEEIPGNIDLSISEDPMNTLGGTIHTIDPFSGSARGSLKKPAWTNEELMGKYTPTSLKEDSLNSVPPDSDDGADHSGDCEVLPSPTKPSSPPNVYVGSEHTYAPTCSISDPDDAVYGYLPAPAPPPPESFLYEPPISVSPPQAMHHVPKPFELTAEIISKAQKRCRYAISALDYEDAETARNELREALALLDGKL